MPHLGEPPPDKELNGNSCGRIFVPTTNLAAKNRE